jgi:hypothetical protein
MFYQADDVKPAFVSAEGLLGKNGRIDVHATHRDVAVMTDAFGKIWYGDLDSYENVHTLANILKVPCKVIDATGYSLPKYIAEPSAV